MGEPVGMTHEEVARRLGGPGARRVGGYAAVEHFAAGDADEEQQVAAAQQNGVDSREVTGNTAAIAQISHPGTEGRACDKCCLDRGKTKREAPRFRAGSNEKPSEPSNDASQTASGHTSNTRIRPRS